MQNNLIKIAVTGHRDITIEQENKLRPVVAQAIKNIIAYEQTHNYKRPNCVILSALADGADCLVAEVGLELYQKLYYYLPFDEIEYGKSISNKTRHNTLKDKAAKTVVVEQDNFDAAQLQTPGYDGKLYEKLGDKLIADCDYIIAILDPTRQKNGKGGTKHVAERAKEKGKILLAINPADENPIISFEYFFSDENLAKYRKAALGDFIDGNAKILNGLYHTYDTESGEDKKEYEKVWKYCWNIGLVTALALAIKIAFVQPGTILSFILSLAELLGVCLIFYYLLRDSAKQYYSNFVWTRFIAENARINELFYYCGYHNFNTTRKVHIQPQGNKNKFQKLLHRTFKGRDIEENTAYIIDKAVQLTVLPRTDFCNKKLQINELVNGQINYHQSKISFFKHKIHVNHLWSTWLIGIFFALLVFHLLHELAELHWLTLFHIEKYDWAAAGYPQLEFLQVDNFVMLFSLFLPAAIARLEGGKFISDWAKKKKESEFMVEFFEEIKPKVADTNVDMELCQVLNGIHNVMTNEVTNWEVSMINSGKYLGV